jgi:hypothetical protein
MSLLRTGAWALALGRVGFGVDFAAEPERLLKVWVGPEPAAAPLVQMVARSLGARDAVIGAGTLLALLSKRSTRGWFLAGALVDLYDLAVTAAAKEHLPPNAVRNTAAIVGPAVAVGLAAAVRRRP